MVFPGTTSAFALLPLGRRCRSAKVQRRKWEDATAKHEDAKTKLSTMVRRRRGDSTIAICLRNFAISPSKRHTFVFDLFYCIQQHII